MFYGIHFVVLEMKLNVLINLFTLHECLPERRCTHPLTFWANYSSAVIEVDVSLRCRLRESFFGGGEGVLRLMGWRGSRPNCACLRFCSGETFWARITNHKTKALCLISAIHHGNFCFLTQHINSYFAASALITRRIEPRWQLSYLHTLVAHFLIPQSDPMEHF